MQHILRKETLHMLPKPLPSLVCGIDEAGRGPWAGPVVAAAVIFKGKIPKDLRDSKKLSQQSRELLFDKIMECSYVGVGVQDASTIDTIGIKKSTNNAMLLALKELSATPSLLLVDGRDTFTFPYEFFSIIKGDDLLPHVSAASIIAKVTRDRLMLSYHEQFPQYGFDKHKGYGTKYHQEALRLHGVSSIHRISYKPISYLLTTSLSEV